MNSKMMVVYMILVVGSFFFFYSKIIFRLDDNLNVMFFFLCKKDIKNLFYNVI